MPPKKRIAHDDASLDDSDDDDAPVRAGGSSGAKRKLSPVRAAPAAKAKSQTQTQSSKRSKTAGGDKPEALLTAEEKMWKKENALIDTIVPVDDKDKWWIPRNRAKLVEQFKKGIRFETLEHKGPLLAPPYEKHGLPIMYGKKVVTLTVEEEELATFYAEMRDSLYYKKKTFRDNFWEGFTKVLHKRKEVQFVQDLAMVNFDQIYDRFVREKERKKAIPSAEKKEAATKRTEEELPYKWCTWDGRKERISNIKVEPPGLFRGRGQHPKMGMIKPRILASDIIINCSDVKNPPPAPGGGKWKEVVCNKGASWLAQWHDAIMGDMKTMMLDKSSAWKQFKDMEKFDKAQRLVKLIPDIRKSYQASFKSSQLFERQRAVAAYFIDILALRVGGEKSEQEADTVGCCSLRVPHLTLMTTWGNHPKNEPEPPVGDPKREKQWWIYFDFLGKDSIRYRNHMKINKEVYELIEEFKVGKGTEDVAKNQIFNLVQPNDMNEYFRQFMPGLSAKVFRTYNASALLCKMFREQPVPKNYTETQKKVYFDKCNTDVAILCNHQKTVGKGHAEKVEEMKGKVDEMREQLKRLEACEKDMKKLSEGSAAWDKKWDEHKSAWDKEEERKQWEWLDKWGTEEERDTYRQELKEGKSSAKSAAPKKKRSSGATRFGDDEDDDLPVRKKAKKEKKEKKSKKEKKEGKKKRDFSEGLLGKGGGGLSKLAQKKRAKAAPQVADDDDSDSDDDDVPVRRRGAAAAAAAPAADDSED